MRSGDSGGGNGGGHDSKLGCGEEARPFGGMAGGPEG